MLTQEHQNIFFHKKSSVWSEKHIYCSDVTGNVCDEKVSAEMIKFFDDLYEESRTFWNLQIDCEFKSYEDFIHCRLEEFIKNDSEELKKVKRAILRQQSKILCIEIGCARLNESSVKEYGSYVRFDDVNIEFPGGYSTLVDFLASKIPASLIKLNQPVESVKIEENAELSVVCQNGETYKADHVLVTSSLNYLKKNYEKFLPKELLTDKKITALNNLKMGYVNKFILIYDDMSFYPQNKDSVHVLFPDNDYDSKDYDMRTEWYKKIPKFDKFYDNILRALITGEEAFHVESLSENEISIVLTRLLRNIFKNDSIPLPNRVIRLEVS